MTTNPSAAAPDFRRIGDEPPFHVSVRGRPFLAGSGHTGFPESIRDAGGMIPVLETEQANVPLPELVASVRRVLDDELSASGGVVLRGLPIIGKPAFESLLAQLGYPSHGYRGGIAVRKRDPGLALEASSEDHRITLSPHNEMAYLPAYPRRIFFFCDVAARQGGEVPVNDIRETVKGIPADVLKEFRERGIRYHRSLPRVSSDHEMGWVDTFGTDDRTRVEEHMTASGYDYTWTDSGGLRYSYRWSAFVPHPDTGEELWFNQVTELHCSYWRAHPGFRPDLPDEDYPATTTYGDGTAIDGDLISFLRGALWRTTRAVRMRKGDVLVLDNQVLQHGRFAYEGTRRHFVGLAR